MSRAATFDPFRETTGPPQRQCRSVSGGLGLGNGTLRQRGDEAPPILHAVLTPRDGALGMRAGEHDRECRGIVRQQNVGYAAVAQLGANRDVPQEGQGERRRSTAAAEYRFEGRGGIEDNIDRAGLQRLVGFTTFGDIHPRDLVDEAGEVTAGQLTMDDRPDHASLPYGI